jgi:hypothetical protein
VDAMTELKGAPRIEDGVTQADIDAWGNNCFDAGRSYQRKLMHERITRAELDLMLDAAIEAGKQQAREELLHDVRTMLNTSSTKRREIVQALRARRKAVPIR